MTVSGVWRVTALLFWLFCAWVDPAFAYRPFDFTDASVAKRGEVEFECGPFGYVVEADGRFLVVPGAIVNFGLSDRWELVIEGRHFFQLERLATDRRDTLRDTALSVKGLLREGSLQERQGPSVAVEMGVLLPGIGTDPGLGASMAGIVSQRWSHVTVHVNGELLLTHDHSLGAAGGAIVEGPSTWVVRPVAEVVVEEDVGRTASALVGGIWKVRDNLSLDAGWRIARADGANVREFRAGFTWAIPLGGEGAARTGPSILGPQGRPRV
jgi:hypothetical protein